MNATNQVFGIDGNDTKLAETGFICKRTIDVDVVRWHQYMLIPASLCIFVFAWLHRRRNILPKLFGGRPGLPRPLHFLDDKHNREVYVAGFSVTAWMLQAITVGGMRFGVESEPSSSYWVRVLASLLLGVICYPIFGGFSSNHTVGYAIGTLYIWILTISFVLLNYPCENLLFAEADSYEKIYGALKLLEFLPCFGCLMYLAIMYPRRLVRHIRGVKSPIAMNKKEEEHELPYLQYVHLLMSKKKSTTEKPAATWCRWRGLMRKIYVPAKGFRYSVSILSAVFVSMLLLFTTMLTWMQMIVIGEGFARKLSQQGHSNSTAEVIRQRARAFGAMAKIGMFLMRQVAAIAVAERRVTLAKLISACIYFAFISAFFMTMMTLLNTLKVHRKHLLDSYKGVFNYMATYERAPRSVVVDALRYIGYQFAFAIWGYSVIAAIILGLLGLVGVLVAVLFYGVGKKTFRPIVVVILVTLLNSLLLMLLQHVVVHFFFVQQDKNGKRILAFNNRSLFVNFQYFVVFPNAARGFYMCMFRVLLAAIFSLWTLPRLDRSALPRQFEKCDDGFRNYIGLLRMESAQTNPTMLTFVYLLMKCSALKPRKQPRPPMSVLMLSDSNTIYRPGSKTYQALTTPRQQWARNRWLLWYTLIRNPSLKRYRKRRMAEEMAAAKKNAELEKVKAASRKCDGMLVISVPMKKTMTK